MPPISSTAQSDVSLEARGHTMATHEWRFAEDEQGPTTRGQRFAVLVEDESERPGVVLRPVLYAPLMLPPKLDRPIMTEEDAVEINASVRSIIADGASDSPFVPSPPSHLLVQSHTEAEGQVGEPSMSTRITLPAPMVEDASSISSRPSTSAMTDVTLASPRGTRTPRGGSVPPSSPPREMVRPWVMRLPLPLGVGRLPT